MSAPNENDYIIYFNGEIIQLVNQIPIQFPGLPSWVESFQTLTKL
jgi:hypothetical protein